MDDEIGFRVETHLGKHLRRGDGRFWADKREWYEGEDARRAMNSILSLINFGGGRSRDVAHAVSRIEDHGHSQRFLTATVEEQERYASKGIPGWIHKMPKPTRLALEMAVHEEDERRALEGELWRLEAGMARCRGDRGDRGQPGAAEGRGRVRGQAQGYGRR